MRAFHPAKPVELRKISQPARFAASTPFLDDRRVVQLLAMEAAGLSSRMQSKWNEMIAANADSINGPPIPWDVSSAYADTEEYDDVITAINDDIKQVVDLAFRWRILGDLAAAYQASEILDAYSEVTFVSGGYPDRVDNSRLNWSNRWPCFIQAAMLISDSPAYGSSLHDRMQDATDRGSSLSWGTDAKRAFFNWGSWGLVCDFATATFLEDRSRFDMAIQRWCSHFDQSVKPLVGAAGTQTGVLISNVPFHEVYREGNTQGDGSTGLWYSSFWLNAVVQSAEWARFGGEWLYDYTSPNGSSLYGAWENVANWMSDPADYPFNTSGTPSTLSRLQAFVDILHVLWPEVLSAYSADTNGDGLPDVMTDKTTTQDYVGFRGSLLAYRGRTALYG